MEDETTWRQRLTRLFRRGEAADDGPIAPQFYRFTLTVAEHQLLRDCLGHDGYDLMMRRLWERMATVIPDCGMCGDPGRLWCRLPADDMTGAQLIARQLMARVQQPLTVQGLSVTPHLLPELAAENRSATTCDLTQAIAAGQIEAWFQPQIDGDTGAVTGFEALARWQHPQRGLLLPNEFLPEFAGQERQTLAVEMLRQAGTALQSWDKAGWNVGTISINLSEYELAETVMAEILLWELDRLDLHPSRLVIEVLESVAPPQLSGDDARDAAIAGNLRRLAAAGCRIDLDDFGTGFASLDSIRQFGPQRLKIDRRFIAGCDSAPEQQRMILAILALADNLGLDTLAEGVETVGEQAFLTQIGCNQLQGYAIARPMPFHETGAFLASRASMLAHLPQLIRRVG